jgi:hypothetical protein
MCICTAYTNLACITACIVLHRLPWVLMLACICSFSESQTTEGGGFVLVSSKFSRAAAENGLVVVLSIVGAKSSDHNTEYKARFLQPSARQLSPRHIAN